MAEILRPSWMTDAMYNEWILYYLEAGGDGVPGADTRATEMFRQSPSYESYFPGIKDENGRIRFRSDPEQTYFDNIASYRNIVEGMQLNPDVFSEDYVSLIEGDTSPAEFASRMNALEDRVASQGEAIRGWYANEFGIDMTRESILASLMSPRVEQAVFERQITMAEIGGEAALRNYDLTQSFVESLAQAGMDRAEAQRLFGTAEALLPALNVMAARHGDPNDPFNITEFATAGAKGLGAPEVDRRISMVQAQEQAGFTGGAQLNITRDQRTGGLTGLEAN